MVRNAHLKKGLKWLVWLFILSLVSLSIVSASIGLRGHKVPFRQLPTQPYQEVSFASQVRDHLPLGGWFFPAFVPQSGASVGKPVNSNKVAVIAHGWGGHRARLLPLAQFLQRHGVSVLTFDLRGGTGRNTYGFRESGDIAGAVHFLKTSKRYESDQISVIGASMGGAAAVDFASKNQIDTLILISPIIDIGHAKYTVLKDRHFIFPSLYAAGATVIEWLVFGVRPANPIKIFDRIDEPTLILHTTNDALSPVSDVYHLRRELIKRNQLNVVFDIIDGAEHTFLDHDEENGFPYSQKILEFIQK